MGTKPEKSMGTGNKVVAGIKEKASLYWLYSTLSGDDTYLARGRGQVYAGQCNALLLLSGGGSLAPQPITVGNAYAVTNTTAAADMCISITVA